MISTSARSIDDTTFVHLKGAIFSGTTGKDIILEHLVRGFLNYGKKRIWIP
jgi:hypothetical protein